MRFVRLYIFVLTAALLASHAPVLYTGIHAAAPGQSGIHPENLRKIIDSADARNADIAAAREQINAAAFMAEGAGTLADPRLHYGYFLEEIETRTGPQEHRVGISQTFPGWGTRKAERQVAGSRIAVAEKQLAATRESVFKQIKIEYYRLLFVNSRIPLISEQIQRLEYLAEVADVRYRTGGISQSDIIGLNIEIDRLKERITSLEIQRSTLISRLRSLVQGPLPDLSGELLPLNEPGGLPPQNELEDALERSNPEIAGLDARAETAAHGVRLAEVQDRLEITVGLDYLFTGESRIPGTADSGDDPVLAKISLNLPLFRNKYDAATAHRKALRQAVLQRRAQATERLRAELRGALNGVRDARNRLELYENNLIPQGNRRFELEQQAYVAGETAVDDVIAAEQAVLEFQLMALKSRLDIYTHLINVEFLTGEPLPAGTHDAESAAGVPMMEEEVADTFHWKGRIP